MSKASNLIVVGKIVGVFGIKGWVKVKSWTDPAHKLTKYTPWWLKTCHGVKEFAVAECNYRPQGLVVHLKGLDDRDAAQALGSVEIAIEKQQLDALEEGDYYWHQLQGMTVLSVYDGQESRLGTVHRLLETGANDVLVVAPDQDSIDDRERMVPYVPDIYVQEVNLSERVIRVAWDPDF